MYGYENDELSPVAPQFLEGTGFPTDTERLPSLFSSSLPVCSVKKCDVTSLLKL